MRAKHNEISHTTTTALATIKVIIKGRLHDADKELEGAFQAITSKWTVLGRDFRSFLTAQQQAVSTIWLIEPVAWVFCRSDCIISILWPFEVSLSPVCVFSDEVIYQGSLFVSRLNSWRLSFHSHRTPSPATKSACSTRQYTCSHGPARSCSQSPRVVVYSLLSLKCSFPWASLSLRLAV